MSCSTAEAGEGYEDEAEKFWSGIGAAGQLELLAPMAMYSSFQAQAHVHKCSCA